MTENLLKKGYSFELKAYDTTPLAIEDVANGRADCAAVSNTALKNAQDKGLKVRGPVRMPVKLLKIGISQGDVIELTCDGADEVQALLDVLSTTSPALAANLVPKAVSLPVLTRVLQLLLMEAIPIRDFRRIAEAIAMHGEAIPDPVVLAERIRPALGGIIIQRVAGLGVSLRVVVFDPALEDLLVRAVRTTGAGCSGSRISIRRAKSGVRAARSSTRWRPSGSRRTDRSSSRARDTRTTSVSSSD